MFALKPEDFIIYLKKVAKVIEENKEYITELDSETGDGDHWLNMNIGFQKLVEKTGEWKQMNFQELFQKYRYGIDVCYGWLFWCLIWKCVFKIFYAYERQRDNG